MYPCFNNVFFFVIEIFITIDVINVLVINNTVVHVITVVNINKVIIPIFSIAANTRSQHRITVVVRNVSVYDEAMSWRLFKQ